MIAYVTNGSKYWIAERPDGVPSSCSNPNMYMFLWTTSTGEEILNTGVRIVNVLEAEHLQDAVKKYPELMI